MTLEEAIKHAEEKARCGGKCGEDHAQLAMWLRELQKLRTVKTEKRNGKSAQNVSKEDLISRKAAIDALDSINCCGYVEEPWDIVRGIIERVPAAEPEKHTEERTETHACDSISRQAAIDALADMHCKSDEDGYVWIIRSDAWARIDALPSAQPEIVRCKDCKYGEQDEAGRWFCISLGCQIGNEDGSGYCADAERRTHGSDRQTGGD